MAWHNDHQGAQSESITSSTRHNRALQQCRACAKQRDRVSEICGLLELVPADIHLSHRVHLVSENDVSGPALAVTGRIVLSVSAPRSSIFWLVFAFLKTVPQ